MRAPKLSAAWRGGQDVHPSHPVPSGHSLLMGNFMGAVRQRAGAICSRDPGVSNRPDLSVTNRSRCHTLPPRWGHGCVTPPGSVPSTLGWILTLRNRTQPRRKDLGNSVQQ